MIPLDISEIEIIPIKPNDGVVAFATCVLNRSVYLSSIAIKTLVDRPGFRLSFPVKTLANGRQFPLFHPLNDEVLAIFEKFIIEKYEELLSRWGESS